MFVFAEIEDLTGFLRISMRNYRLTLCSQEYHHPSFTVLGYQNARPDIVWLTHDVLKHNLPSVSASILSNRTFVLVWPVNTIGNAFFVIYCLLFKSYISSLYSSLSYTSFDNVWYDYKFYLLHSYYNVGTTKLFVYIITRRHFGQGLHIYTLYMAAFCSRI